MGSFEKFVGGVLVIGGMVSLINHSKGFGERGTFDVYTTKINGKPAVVRRIDRRFYPDGYYLQFNEDNRVMNGRIRTDDNKVISIYDRGFYIEDYNSGKK